MTINDQGVRGWLRVRVVIQIIVLMLFVYFASNSFIDNRWGIIGEKWFEIHQRDTEAHVIGNILQSRRGGLLSYAGLNGVGLERVVVEERRSWPKGTDHSGQYTAFAEDRTFSNYNPYLSQSGGQGFFFSLADLILPYGSSVKLKIFHSFTGLLLAIILALLMYWIALIWGWTAAGLAMLSILFSQWMIVFGENLWWSLWAFYLPMLAVAFGIGRFSKTSIRSLSCARWIFIALFIKILFTGYEYITTCVLMTIVPFLTYSILYWPGLKPWFKSVGINVGAGLSAMLLSLLLLCVQISYVKGSLMDGVDHIAFVLGKRSHGQTEQYHKMHHTGLKVDIEKVLRKYREGYFFDMQHKNRRIKAEWGKTIGDIHYQDLLNIFYYASAFLLLSLLFPAARKKWLLIFALLLSAWFSLLAPLSWFIIFKAHSHVHYHMNYIVWHMPWTWISFALLGYTIMIYIEIIRTIYLRVFCGRANPIL